jgi:hypothetical protein
MKRLFSISFFLFTAALAAGQNIERKILIEGGKFYYTTIDEEFQVATLHTGKATEALKTAKHLALPAGRNYSDPVVPFAWDVSGASVFAVNFLMHPLNDRNEALKKIEISALREWTPELKPFDLIMQSVDANMMAYNDPYEFVRKRSSLLENFFYDGITKSDGSYCMVVSNNGELSVWNYTAEGWKHGNIQPMRVGGYFSLFEYKKNTYLLLSDGSSHKIEQDTVNAAAAFTLGTALSSGVLVENKDDGTIKFLKNEKIDQSMPLNELIKKKANPIL